MNFTILILYELYYRLAHPSLIKTVFKHIPALLVFTVYIHLTDFCLVHILSVFSFKLSH